MRAAAAAVAWLAAVALLSGTYGEGPAALAVPLVLAVVLGALVPHPALLLVPWVGVAAALVVVATAGPGDDEFSRGITGLVIGAFVLSALAATLAFALGVGLGRLGRRARR